MLTLLKDVAKLLHIASHYGILSGGVLSWGLQYILVPWCVRNGVSFPCQFASCLSK